MTPNPLALADELEAPIGTMTSYAAAQQDAALLRTQHAAIERKDALLRQALETWDTVCNAFGWDEDHMAAFAAVRKELDQ